MDPDFWRTRWEANQIGFHEGRPNALMERNFSRLDLAAGARIFLPLCGKTRDIAFLLSRGFAVAGAELSELAIAQLFDELAVAPVITPQGALTRYSAPGLDIFVGDIFDLTRAGLGPVDAVYDRAALVALPAAMRARYARHLVALTGGAPQLLVCFAYDQSEMDGPPFSVTAQETRALYGADYRVALLESVPLAGGLKGRVPADEQVWLLEQV